MKNKCSKIDCDNVATKKPVLQMRAAPLLTAHEVQLGISVCDQCATKENADDLISGAKTKSMFQDIFKVQTQGGQVDWSCSGVVWVKI